MSTTSTLAERPSRDAMVSSLEKETNQNQSDSEATPHSNGVLAPNGKTEADVEAAAPQARKALDWDSPDDPGNPRNWPRWKKWYAIVVAGLISFDVTFGTSDYVPSLPAIMTRFHLTSTTVALLGLTLYTFGLVLGPLLGAPLSETHGRKIVYISATPISLLFHFGSGMSNSFAGMLVCRFFAGAFGSPALAIGAGSVADLFDLHEDGATAAAFFIAMPFLGPAAGPIIGSFLPGLGGRWWAWMNIIIGVPGLIGCFFLEETYKPIILKRRAVKRGLPLPPSPPPKQALKMLLTITLFRPMEMLVVEPIVGLMSLYVGYNFGVLYLFFVGFPLSFTEAYGFSRQQSGLTFLGVGAGVILAGLVFVCIDKAQYQRLRRKAKETHGEHSELEPEHRLYGAMLGSLLIPMGIFWFAWTTYPGVHWISAVLAGAVFGCGNFCIFLGVVTYMVDTYQARAGASAAAANGLVRYTLGAVFPLFAFQMYDGLGRHAATSLLGGLSVLMLPIPWVFFKFGARIRQRSKYAVAVVGHL